LALGPLNPSLPAYSTPEWREDKERLGGGLSFVARPHRPQRGRLQPQLAGWRVHFVKVPTVAGLSEAGGGKLRFPGGGLRKALGARVKSILSQPYLRAIRVRAGSPWDRKASTETGDFAIQSLTPFARYIDWARCALRTHQATVRDIPSSVGIWGRAVSASRSPMKSTLIAILTVISTAVAAIGESPANNAQTKPRVVVVFGDSITARSELPKDQRDAAWVRIVERESLGKLKMVNEGRGGRPTKSVPEFEAMLAHEPQADVLVIALGTNDSRDISSACVPNAVENVRKMIALARVAYGSALPVLLVGPPNINTTNRRPARSKAARTRRSFCGARERTGLRFCEPLRSRAREQHDEGWRAS